MPADFPILIKYIDAGDALSIQVHPDDTYARTQGEPYGKTEMWVVLDCDPGASLYYGFKEAVTPQRYRESLADGTILELLNAVAVHPGDVFFINAGTVHAIGQGIMVCEIQQNSDTTYRVYDYDRHDPQGLSRPLHIKDALAVSALSPPAKEPGTAPYPLTAIAGGSRQLLGQCPQFRTTLYRCETTVDIEVTPQSFMAEFRTTLYRCETTVDIEVTPQSFMAVVGLKGKGHLQLNGQEGLVTPQDLWFIPAQEGTVTLTGPCEVLAVDVPGA